MKRQNDNKKTNRGFTLIELLVVVSIIGTLSSVVLSTVSSAREKAANAAKSTYIKSYIQAFELYSNDHGNNYPYNGVACLGSDNLNDNCYGPWYGENSTFNSMLTPYISVLAEKRPIIIESDWGTYDYRGVVYFCIDPAGSMCKTYALAWVEEGWTDCPMSNLKTGWPWYPANTQDMGNVNSKKFTNCWYSSNPTFFWSWW